MMNATASGCFVIICTFLEDWKVRHAPVTIDEEPDDWFVEACQMLDYIEYLADLLTVGDLDQWENVVTDLMKEGNIIGLEDLVMRARGEERRTDYAEKINAAS